MINSSPPAGIVALAGNSMSIPPPSFQPASETSAPLMLRNSMNSSVRAPEAALYMIS